MLLEAQKFLILSLPRSRSAWLAHFLRYSGKLVAHDLATECSSVSDFRAKFELVDGAAETGAVLGWRLLHAEIPGVRLITIRRDWREVGASLAAAGCPPPWEDLLQRSVMLDQVDKMPGTLSLSYHDLGNPAVCKILFEHCLEFPFDWSWWAQMDATNIQVDMRTRLLHLAGNHAQLEAFKAEVVRRSSEVVQCLN